MHLNQHPKPRINFVIANFRFIDERLPDRGGGSNDITHHQRTVDIAL